MKGVWRELRLMVGETVIWWGIRICGHTPFGDEMLLAFRDAMTRDAERLAKELNTNKNGG